MNDKEYENHLNTRCTIAEITKNFILPSGNKYIKQHILWPQRFNLYLGGLVECQIWEKDPENKAFSKISEVWQNATHELCYGVTPTGALVGEIVGRMTIELARKAKRI